jgi:hypothetical protein
MNNELRQGVGGIPEIPDTDSIRVKIRMENRGKRFTIWREMRITKGEHNTHTMTVNDNSTAVSHLAYPFDMICNLITFRCIFAVCGYLDIRRSGKSSFYFIIFIRELAIRYGHGGENPKKIKKSVLFLLTEGGLWQDNRLMTTMISTLLMRIAKDNDLNKN